MQLFTLRIAVIVLIDIFAASAGAGTTLVKDLRTSRTEAIWQKTRSLTVVGGIAFFSACNQSNGCELWKTDGTVAGTGLVMDINPGPESASPDSLTAFAGKLFFSAEDGVHGRELWQSDGTADGTRLIDILPGGMGSSPSELAPYGSVLIFQAQGIFGQGSELWRTDGTISGTVLVKNINPFDPGSSLPKHFVAFNGKLYFSAFEPGGGEELWQTDGTEQGTTQVLDVRPGSDSSRPSDFVAIGAMLYFTAEDSQSIGGRELWSTDGTGAGSSLVKTWSTASYRSTPRELVDLAGALYFIVDAPGYGSEPWRSDGTTTGTTLLKDIEPGAAGSSAVGLRTFAGRLWFTANTAANGFELWSSDGTPAGTQMFADLILGTDSSSPVTLTPLDPNRMAFATVGGNKPRGLWLTDGSLAGTLMIKELGATVFDGIYEMVAFAPGALFIARNGTAGQNVWRTDGTPAGTYAVSDVSVITGSDPLLLTAMRGQIYFSADDGVTGRELWSSDGTAQGTRLVKDIDPAFGSNPYSLVANGGSLFFAAQHPSTGYELWISDGTAAGTRLVKDINPGAGSSYPSEITAVGSRVYFVADDGISGGELWRSDGTAAGTTLVKDIWTGIRSSFPSHLTAANGTLYFQAATSAAGAEPWRSDGTDAGTWLLLDTEPGVVSGRPSGFAPVKGRIVFSTSFDGWTTDGTSAGTVKLPVRPASAPDERSNRQCAGGRGTLSEELLFTSNALDGGGIALWRSDGTVSGTTMIKQLPDGFSPSVRHFCSTGAILYFTYDSGDGIRNVWRTDGTASGTVAIASLAPFASSAFDFELAATAEGAFFAAHRPDSGVELWSVPAGSFNAGLEADISPGARSSLPTGLTIAADKLYFVADDGMRGPELYATQLLSKDSTPPVIESVVDGGSLGATGWYRSDVSVRWLAWDEESSITSSVGCTDLLVNSDTAGISSNCTATSTGGTTSRSLVIRRDRSSPNLVCPPNVSLESANPAGAVATFAASATDAVSPVVVLSYQPESASMFPIGTSRVTVTATDEAQNTARCEFVVTVLWRPDGGSGSYLGNETEAGDESDAGLAGISRDREDASPTRCGCNTSGATSLFVLALALVRQRG